ncbi:MAG: chorismate-binding protein [Cyanobacteria bacterium K_Offshore_surface_m2_239]|nr:chorismate-binding protein [Cyanobacteria bacterium K_Offshore_surface_m2_239]
MAASASSYARLLRLLCGSFSNQTQAFENPPLFAHILVTYRPLPQLQVGSLLLEQSYAIDPGTPYRIRVLRPVLRDDQILIQNFALRDETRFWGATQDADRRATLQESDLQPLPGCDYLVREQGEGFVGEVEPGCRCLIERKGATAYLVSQFELWPEGMRTIDRGHHPDTHERLWGSLAGPFEFERTDDHSAELPDLWIAPPSGGVGQD